MNTPHLDCVNPRTKKPDGQFHSLERLFAYQTVKKLEDENIKPGGNWTNPEDYDLALRLALKFNFVTEITSLVVTTSSPIILHLHGWDIVTSHKDIEGFGGFDPSADSVWSDVNDDLTTCSPNSSNITIWAKDGETMEFSEAVPSLSEHGFENRMTALSVSGDECAAWVIYKGNKYRGLWKRFGPGDYVSYSQISYLYQTARSLKCVMLNNNC